MARVHLFTGMLHSLWHNQAATGMTWVESETVGSLPTPHCPRASLLEGITMEGGAMGDTKCLTGSERIVCLTPTALSHSNKHVSRASFLEGIASDLWFVLVMSPPSHPSSRLNSAIVATWSASPSLVPTPTSAGLLEAVPACLLLQRTLLEGSYEQATTITTARTSTCSIGKIVHDKRCFCCFPCVMDGAPLSSLFSEFLAALKVDAGRKEVCSRFRQACVGQCRGL